MKNKSIHSFQVKNLIKEGEYKEYAEMLASIKRQIQYRRIKVALSAGKQLMLLYWYIGKTIVEKQKESQWGSSFVEQLTKDLQNEFPELEGFSRTNIFRMRAFYLTYEKAVCAMSLQQFKVLPMFNIPWGHNVMLIERLKNNAQRFWYANKVIELGLSRSMLEEFIKTGIYERQSEVVVSTQETLSFPPSDIAQSSLIDSWIFWAVLLCAVIIVHNKIRRA